ncbi:MAG: Histidine kinase, partial [Watsoniomyces obsoletus]
MDQPRIVGFSQPYITDTVDNAENDHREPPDAEMSTRQGANANKNRLEFIASISQDAADTHDFATGATNGTGESPVTASRPPKPPSMKVLVAEDNKVNQEVIKRMLKLEKLNDVEIAEDGQQALDAIRDSMGEAPDGSKTSPYQLV